MLQTFFFVVTMGNYRDIENLGCDNCKQGTTGLLVLLIYYAMVLKINDLK